MDPVVHFQMPAEDRGRVRKFYEEVFGWKTTQLNPEMGDYVLATTAPTDEENMILKPGAINGGFFQKTDDSMSQCPSIVIQVEDIQEAIRKVEAAGGKITGGVQDMPQIGLFAAFLDTEGNHVTLMQPEKRVG